MRFRSVFEEDLDNFQIKSRIIWLGMHPHKLSRDTNLEHLTQLLIKKDEFIGWEKEECCGKNKQKPVLDTTNCNDSFLDYRRLPRVLL